MLKNRSFLGAGSAAKVFLEEYQGREYAIKCPSTEEDGIVALLEIDILSRLNHPHLARAEFFSIHPEQKDYLELWLPRGQVYTPQKYSPLEQVEICWQLSTGLACLHQHGILHLDLDLSNIVKLTENGRQHWQIIDFGLSRLRQCCHHYTVTILSSRPPEILEHDLRRTRTTPYPLSEACDIWSLGLIFLRLVTGQPNLFRCSTEAHQCATFRRHFGTTRATTTTLETWIREPNLLDLLQRMLVWRPDQRLSSSALLEHPYFTSQSFSPPLPLPTNEVPINPELNLDLSQDLLELVGWYFDETTIPARVIIRGVDLFYRLASTGITGLDDFLLLVCLVFATKLEDVCFDLTTTHLNHDEYIEAEKMVVIALECKLRNSLRPTPRLGRVQEYLKESPQAHHEFFERSSKSLYVELRKIYTTKETSPV